MKKALCLSTLTFLLSTLSAVAHTSQAVHIHPHGENAFLTTWIVAGLIGFVLGGRLLMKRLRRN